MHDPRATIVGAYRFPLLLQMLLPYMIFDGEDGGDDEYLCEACAAAEGGAMSDDPCFRWLFPADAKR